jgi:hypothetical protein
LALITLDVLFSTEAVSGGGILLALVVLAVLLFTEAVSLCFWLNSRVGVFGDAYSFL